MGSERFVAAGLLTPRDLDVLGSGFRRAFPLNDMINFTFLLTQIDEAERGSRSGAAIAETTLAPAL